MAWAVKRDAGRSVAAYRRGLEPRPDEERRTLLDGVPVPAAAPRERHRRIVMTLAGRRDPPAEPRGCRARPDPAIPSDADDGAPIPDLVVRCGPPLPEGCATDPLCIAEAPSAMSLDGRPQFDFGRTNSEAARVAARRRAGQDWSVAALGLDGAVRVRKISRGLAF